MFTIWDIVKGLVSPFFIFVALIIYFQYYKKVEKPIRASLISICYGIIGGAIATVSLIYLRIYIIPVQYMYILFISLALSIIDSRFICFSYGGSLISIISLIFGYPKIDIYELMIVIALLHAIEGLLILINGSSQRMFNIFNIKGKIKEGYEFNRFWPIPFVIFIGDTMIKPFLLFAILSYGDFTIGRLPQRKSIETGIYLFLYSSLLFTVTIISPYRWLPPVFSLFAHEFIIFINKHREMKKINNASSIVKGVSVMDVQYKSIARKLGIKRGDIILKVNHLNLLDGKDFMDLNNKDFNRVKVEYFSHKKGIVKKSYIGKKSPLGIKIS